MVTVTDLILCVWVGHIQQMIPIVLVEVKGNMGSPEVKRSEPCKHDISRRITLRNLILSMQVAHIMEMIPTVYGKGQRSFGVTRGQIVKTLDIARKHHISSTIFLSDLILAIWITHSQYMIPNAFEGGQRSFEVTRGQKVKTL